MGWVILYCFWTSWDLNCNEYKLKRTYNETYIKLTKESYLLNDQDCAFHLLSNLTSLPQWNSENFYIFNMWTEKFLILMHTSKRIEYLIIKQQISQKIIIRTLLRLRIRFANSVYEYLEISISLVKSKQIQNFNSFILVLQNNSSHSILNRVRCEKQILPPVGFEPKTSCIRGKRLPAWPQWLHGRVRTNRG